jgi:hypothetical protein
MGRFLKQSSGAVLDLLPRGGYRAKERFSSLIVQQPVLCAEQLPKNARYISGGSVSQISFAVDYHYDALCVALGQSHSSPAMCTAFFLTSFVPEMTVPAA